MPRPKFQTLTEQMFYILLCLKDECYGIDIFDKISALTGDQLAPVRCITCWSNFWRPV